MSTAAGAPSTPEESAEPAAPLARADAVATRRSLWLTLGAAILGVLAFLAGWFIASPHYPDSTSTDAGFARDMQVHHGQAVAMSLTVRSNQPSPAVAVLAYDIATTQENQRGQMRGWLQTWGLPQAGPQAPMAWMSMPGHHGSGGSGGSGSMLLPDGRMPGMASAAQLAQLNSARGAAADVLFLRLMIVHHRAGALMAQTCVALCSQPDVLSLARSMVAGQNSEITLMQQMLTERGASARL